MRRILAASAALCLLGGAIPLPSPARAAVAAPECPNAAVNYLHAASAITASGSSAQIQQVEWSALEGKVTWDELPADFKAAFEVVPKQAVRAFLAGSRIRCCQFYIARDEGINTLLPHLGPMRQLARIVRVDARGQLAQGNAEAAAERVAGLFRMSAHLSSDGLLISSLVGVAIAAVAHQEAGVILTSGRDSPAARRILSEALTEMPDDPFGFRKTIQGEREWILGWVGREFRGPNAGAELLKVIEGGWGAADAPLEFRLGVSLLDEAGLQRELELIGRYYDEVARLWDAPSAVELLEELDERCKAGEFGLLTPLAAAFARARSAADRGEDELNRTLKLLEAEPGR